MRLVIRIINAIIYMPPWWFRQWLVSRKWDMPRRERLLYVFAFQRWRKSKGLSA